MVRTTKESYNSHAEVIYPNFFCKQKGTDFNVNALGSFPETSKAPVAAAGAAASALDTSTVGIYCTLNMGLVFNGILWC